MFALPAATYALAALWGAIAVLLLRELRLRRDLAALGERVRELSGRLEAAEHELSRAATSAEVAESLLVEKGIADEDDLEDARRRFGTQDASPEHGYEPRRDGELN